MTKKNYKIIEPLLRSLTINATVSADSLVFKSYKGVVDFNRWNYLDRPESNLLDEYQFMNRKELVLNIFNCIRQLSHELAKTTIEVLASEGCKQLFQFMDYKKKQGISIVSLSQIDRKFIDEMIMFLKNKPAKTESGKLSIVAARKHYTSIKSILSYFVKQGLLSKDIFPYAPFLNINRLGKGVLPYSKSEFSKIMRFLWKQRELILDGNFKGSLAKKLTIYMLIIAAKTGRNTSTIMNMEIDCVQPHPLSPDTHILLSTFKRRGMNSSVQSMKSSYKLNDISSTHKDIGILVNEVINLTEPIRAVSSLTALFIYSSVKGIIQLTDHLFWTITYTICKKEKMLDDQGAHLIIQIKRLRQTFSNRIWQLSGGDPIKTAKQMGNTVPILNTHYLDITPVMERNHKYLGYVLVNELSGNNFTHNQKKSLAMELDIDVADVKNLITGNFNTGVARCSSPYSNDEFEPCTSFLSCFKCPNQVVLESDLYRLFSFYLLLKAEVSFIGINKWKKNYSFVIKAIQNEIIPMFDTVAVNIAMNKAKTDPHLMWIDRKSLISL